MHVDAGLAKPIGQYSRPWKKDHLGSTFIPFCHIILGGFQKPDAGALLQDASGAPFKAAKTLFSNMWKILMKKYEQYMFKLFWSFLNEDMTPG